MTPVLTEPLNVGTADLSRYSEMFVSAYDPDAVLEEFADSVRAFARGHEFGGRGFSERLDFAVDALLTSRLRRIRQHLRRDIIEPDALSRFLDIVEDLSCTSISAAASADEIADAVTTALDDLHAYLLAHELVSDGYLSAETTRESPRNAGQGESGAALSAADTDLVLAA